MLGNVSTLSCAKEKRATMESFFKMRLTHGLAFWNVLFDAVRSVPVEIHLAAVP